MVVSTDGRAGRPCTSVHCLMISVALGGMTVASAPPCHTEMRGHGPLWDLAEDPNSIELIESFLATKMSLAREQIPKFITILYQVLATTGLALLFSFLILIDSTKLALQMQSLE